MNSLACKLSSIRGSLAVTVLIVFVLLTVSAAFMVRGISENWQAFRVVNSSAALWAAEAGLQQAMWEYNYNSCSGMTRVSGNTGCTGDKTLAGTLQGYGDYDVTLDSTNTQLMVTGSVPSRTSAKKVQRILRATLGRPSIFAFGMFANNKVLLRQNSLVDAYNATTPYGGINIDHTNGNVGSNGRSAGIVEIDQNATVYGNVSTGPGGSVLNLGTITGSITDTNSIALPSVVVPTTLTSLTSGGTLTVANNGVYTLNGGDHKYSSIVLGNKSTLNIQGTVRLYLTGDATQTSLNTGTGQVKLNFIDASSNLVIYSDGIVIFNNNFSMQLDPSSAVQTPKPQQLQVFSTYIGTAGVDVSNNGSVFAAIYAPNTDVNVSNNAGFFGAMVGNNASLINNGEVHYDTSLSSLENPFELAIVSNWRDLNSQY